MSKNLIRESMVVAGLVAAALAGAAGVAGAATPSGAVRIDQRTGGTYQVRQTFRQRAIIDKLSRVLNGLPASPGDHSQPALVDNGQIEKIADHPLRGSHKPAP